MGEAPAPRAGFFSNPTPFSFVLTGSTRDDRRGFDDIEERLQQRRNVGPQLRRLSV